MDIRCNTRTTSPYLFQHGPDQRDGLQCFAQTHFVRQDATAMFPMGGETRDAVVDEAHAFDLVWPQNTANVRVQDDRHQCTGW